MKIETPWTVKPEKAPPRKLKGKRKKAHVTGTIAFKNWNPDAGGS